MKYVPLAVLFLAIFSGCNDSRELAGNLGIHESIEIIVALKGVGITADRESEQRDRYSVSVGEADYLRALQVMHEYRLPSEEREHFESVTAPQGFLPTSREMSQLRFDYALSLEVERILSSFPGVLVAKAVVRSNVTPSETDEQIGPTVAVVVRYISSSGNIPFSIDELKKLVMKAVPRSNPDGISITPTRVFIPGGISEGNDDGAETAGRRSAAAYIQLRPFPFRVVASERMKAYAQIGTLLIGSTLAGLVLGMLLSSGGKRKQVRKRVPSNTGQGAIPEVVGRTTNGGKQ